MDSLFSQSYLSRLLRIYTISLITSNYIIIINTCNGLNRTCNYSGSQHKNPRQGFLLKRARSSRGAFEPVHAQSWLSARGHPLSWPRASSDRAGHPQTTLCPAQSQPEQGQPREALTAPQPGRLWATPVCSDAAPPHHPCCQGPVLPVSP